MEWANSVAEKNEGILFPAEIRVVGSYTDRLLKVTQLTFTFRFLSSPPFSLFLPHFFFLLPGI